MFDDAKGDNEVDYLDKEASNRFFKAMMEADKAKGLFADMREDEERFDLFKSFNPDRKDGYTLADYTKAFQHISMVWMDLDDKESQNKQAIVEEEIKVEEVEEAKQQQKPEKKTKKKSLQTQNATSEEVSQNLPEEAKAA